MAHEKILIIDDDPDLVYALRLPLEAAGYQVSSAGNGRAGLQTVKRVNPDLIILDAMMDWPTDGFHVCLALRNPTHTSEYAAYRSIPIFMLTAIHSTTALRFAPDPDYLPVDSFLEKPLSPNELLDQVRQQLDKSK
jgi:two-component system alkaline phosphatase synthesis response regulator PhoP